MRAPYLPPRRSMAVELIQELGTLASLALLMWLTVVIYATVN